MTVNNYVSASSDREADIVIANVKRSMWADLSKKINPENPDRKLIEHAIARGFEPEGKDLEKESPKIREMIQDVIREQTGGKKGPVYICSHNGNDHAKKKEHVRGE